jgi:hypothetical protein
MDARMRSERENRPGFIGLQLAFAAHVRDPGASDPPPGVPAERMQVYVDLVFHS